VNIFNLIGSNLRIGPITLRFPDRPPVPAGFRGFVEMDAARCVACGTCAYVCPSAAITESETGDEFEWQYDAGHCTYCGRCVALCPNQALAQDEEPPPPYTSPSEARKEYIVPFPICPECGERTRPLSEAVLAKAFPNMTEEVREWGHLCARCRRKRSQRAVAATLVAREAPPSGR
jgi:hydrogenase-4 component H